MNVVEKVPPAPRVRVREPLWARVLVYGLRQVWVWRLELTAALLVAVVWLELTAVVPAPATVAVFTVAWAGLLCWPRSRLVVVGLVYRASLRRRWGRACRHAELATFNDRIPRMSAHRRIGAGDLLRVRIPAGSCTGELVDAADRLASYLQVSEVRVASEPVNARYAWVTLVRRDPLAGTEELAWPLLAAERLSLWDPFPVGVGEDGEVITMSLLWRNLLLGGEPGSGKSVALSVALAVAALDPDAELYLLDGKRVELAVWKPVAAAFAGPDLTNALDILRRVQAVLDRRLDVLEASGRRKINPGEFPLIVVACDELAYYLSVAEVRDPRTGKLDRDAPKEFATLDRDLAARGRAVGIIVLNATQRPSSDIVPTSLRDLHAFRWAFRCSTRDASDTILGAGMATAGITASDLAPEQRGVGWLLAEDGTPTRLRAYHLSDTDLHAIVDSARHLRAAWADLRRDNPDDGGPGLAVVA